MRFTNFISNEKVKEQLTYLVESKRLPHAIIIEGEEGIGKRTLAKELALNLFCRGEDKPCLECPQCSKLLKGLHPDYIEYTAENRKDAFHIRKIREIRDDAYMSPNEADYKIYVLGNAQSMTVEAQNALLKVLEEPPSYVIFILTITNKAAMLETVLSRSVVISLEGAELTAGAEYITEKKEDVSYDEAYKALEMWHGNIGKALETLSDGRLVKINGLAEELARGIIADNEYELIKVTSTLSNDMQLLISALGVLKDILRDALFTSVKPMSTHKDTALLLSQRLSREKLLKLIGVCDDTVLLAQSRVNGNIIITKICADLRRAIGR